MFTPRRRFATPPVTRFSRDLTSPTARSSHRKYRLASRRARSSRSLLVVRLASRPSALRPRPPSSAIPFGTCSSAALAALVPSAAPFSTGTWLPGYRVVVGARVDTCLPVLTSTSRVEPLRSTIRSLTASALSPTARARSTTSPVPLSAPTPTPTCPRECSLHLCVPARCGCEVGRFADGVTGS